MLEQHNIEKVLRKMTEVLQLTTDLLLSLQKQVNELENATNKFDLRTDRSRQNESTISACKIPTKKSKGNTTKR